MRGNKIIVAIVALAVCVYAVFIARCTFVIDGVRGLTLFDDAMISMRYARNLVESAALSWNVGDANIEGYTNLLWTLWMALAHVLPLSDLTVSFVIAITGAVVLLVTGRVVLALMHELRASCTGRTFAIAATLFSYPLVFWTLRGMEVGLLACLATTGALLSVRLLQQVNRRDLLGLLVCTSAALLTRTDAIAFVVVWIGALAFCLPPRERRRVVIRLVLVCVVTLAGHTLFRWAYYGDVMPNTYYLKLEGIALEARLVRGVSSLIRLLQFGWLVPCGLAAFAFAAPEQRRTNVLLAFQVVGCVSYSIYVGGDAWEEFGFPNRYISPALPCLYVLAARGASVIAGSHRWSRAFVLLLCGQAALQLWDGSEPAVVQAFPRDVELRISDALLTLAAAAFVLLRPRSESVLGVVMLLLTAYQPWKDWVHTNAAHIAIDVGRVRHGIAIRDATTLDATIATVPCGSIPYFSRRRTLDLLGKSDPRIAHQTPRTTWFHPGHVKWDNAYMIGELRPDLVDEIFVPRDPALVERDLKSMSGWGYVQITPSIYVQEGTRHVDIQRLLNSLRR